MRWPWDHRDPEGLARARQAAHNARRSRHAVENRWDGINALTHKADTAREQLEAAREENHFGELFTKAFKERPL